LHQKVRKFRELKQVSNSHIEGDTLSESEETGRVILDLKKKKEREIIVFKLWVKKL
jgi:hypothetical protein